MVSFITNLLDRIPYSWRGRVGWITVGLVGLGMLTGWFDSWLPVMLIKPLGLTVKKLAGWTLLLLAYAIYYARLR